MAEPFVIVGGGLAAAKAAERLRDSGYDGDLVLYAAEQNLPYERPPLSKGFLAGREERDSVFVHDAAWYADHDVDLRLGERVEEIDLGDRTVTTRGGTAPYERLLLATGSSPRRLALADDSSAPVSYLRVLEDTERLLDALGDGRRLAIVGGGWIGLEVAATARELGAEVTVLEAAELPLLSVLGRDVAAAFADLHREHGVDLRLGAAVRGIQRSGEGVGLELEDGQVDADLLLVAIGAAPVTDLARRAGLDVDDGVLVDERLRTSDPHVFAAGDIAHAWHPTLGRRVRVEHWDNAVEQGRTAAHSMLGEDVSYDRLPYFFTDQYDLGMEYVGHADPATVDEVVIRGDTSGDRVFRAYWISGGTVVAGMHANDWDAIDGLREQVGHPLAD